MKKFLLSNSWWFCFLLAYILCWTFPAEGMIWSQNSKSGSGLSAPSGCTVITIKKGEKVFFGGNDDYINPDSWFWVEPGDSTRFGVVWIGTPDNPQQGINGKGLAYDSNGLPRVEVNPHKERIPVPGEYHNYCMQIMHECSTVEEVIAWVGKHQRFPYMHDQLHFADKTGDAVIISASIDGEMVFTRKTPGDGYLVSTNFNVANPSQGYEYPCRRYNTASEMMDQFIDREDPITIQDATDVLAAVHVEKGTSWTIETMVADLAGEVVYLYYFYQYGTPVIINLKEELANPREAGPLSRLFPVEIQKEAGRRYGMAQKRIMIIKVTGISWAVIMVVSLIVFLTLSSPRYKGFIFWLLAVIFLGPAGLILRRLALKQGVTKSIKTVLVETTGDLIPLVPLYTLAVIVVILKTLNGGLPWHIQFGLMVGLPVFAGWLIFHGTLLSSAGHRSYGNFVFKRLPQTIVSSFLGLAGIIILAMPLVNLSLSMSRLMPLSPWPVLTWWAVVVLGAVAGGLLISVYEKWAIKRGFEAWNIVAGSEGEVSTPSFNKVWWWILLSFAIFISGLVVAVILLKILAG